MPPTICPRCHAEIDFCRCPGIGTQISFVFLSAAAVGFWIIVGSLILTWLLGGK